MTSDEFARSAELIQQADGLLITAGAGMGVDSGLPDFRGKDGFWKEYPALAQANIAFSGIACPDAFHETPNLAWGFYGHRLTDLSTDSVDYAEMQDDNVPRCNHDSARTMSIETIPKFTPPSPVLWRAGIEILRAAVLRREDE
jgi:hypothetical protein